MNILQILPELNSGGVETGVVDLTSELVKKGHKSIVISAGGKLLDKLEKELPKSLFYHNVKHTVDVVTQSELIGIGEGVSDEELLLLKTHE